MKKYILIKLLYFSLSGILQCQTTTPPCITKFDDGRCKERGTLNKNGNLDGYYIKYSQGCIFSGDYFEIDKGNYNNGRKVGMWYSVYTPQFLIKDYQKIYDKILSDNGIEINWKGNPQIKYKGRKIELGYIGDSQRWKSKGSLIRYIFNIKICGDHMPDSETYDAALEGGHYWMFGYIWYENDEALASWKEPIYSYQDAIKINEKVTKTITAQVSGWKKEFENLFPNVDRIIEEEQRLKLEQEEENRKAKEIDLKIDDQKNHLMDYNYGNALNDRFNELIFKNKFKEAIEVYGEYNDEEGLIRKYPKIVNQEGYSQYKYNVAFALWGLGEFDKSYVLFESLINKPFNDKYILDYFKSDLKLYKKNGTIFPEEKIFIKRLKENSLIY